MRSIDRESPYGIFGMMHNYHVRIRTIRRKWHSPHTAECASSIRVGRHASDTTSFSSGAVVYYLRCCCNTESDPSHQGTTPANGSNLIVDSNLLKDAKTCSNIMGTLSRRQHILETNPSYKQYVQINISSPYIFAYEPDHHAVPQLQN